MDLLARARALARTGVLGDVPAPALIALAERVHVIEVAAGARATTRREGSDFVLVVAAGEVGGHGAGALVGVEGALAGGAPLELAAAQGATVIEIAVDDFLDVLVEHAGASAALARSLAARIRSAPR